MSIRSASAPADRIVPGVYPIIPDSILTPERPDEYGAATGLQRASRHAVSHAALAIRLTHTPQPRPRQEKS
jgi:hypothetical protein